MAQDKGENIVPAPPMNPPPRLSPIPFGEPRGCDGDGCASDRDIWPLHHVIRRGVPCRLCCSCILLSHRSLYCCRCFFLVTSWTCYDHGDQLMAPPAPTVTCQVCREAVAHLPCLYPGPADGVFVCPPCTAAQHGRPFTYAPPCRQPLDMCGARILVLAARMALALLQRHATAARATAERLAQEARDARTRADAAVAVANDLAAFGGEGVEAEAGEEGMEAEANAGEVLLVRRNAMPMLPPLSTLTIGTAEASVVPMAPAVAKHAPSSSQSKPLFDLNENVVDLTENAEEAAQTGPKRQGLSCFNVKEIAMAAAEAARAIPPPTQHNSLQLFPSAKASSSTKMPHTKKPRTKRPRTLQLFKDGEKKI